MESSEAFGRRLLRGATPSSREAFNVGLLAPTSGVQGMYGPGAYACARLACEIWNDEGGVDGREVRLTVVDSGASREAMQADLDCLLERDHRGRRQLDAIITVANTESCQWISRIVDARVPMIYTPHFEGSGLPGWVHAIGETPQRQLLPALDWVASHHRVRRWYLLGQDYCWPRQTHRQAIAHLRSRGDEVVAERYTPLGTEHFDDVVEHIAQSGADAVLLSMVGADPVRLCRAFGKAGLSRRVLRLSVGIDECALLGMGAANTDRMYVAQGYFSGIDSAANGSFKERYHARFGERAPTLGGPAQSIYEGFVHLHRQAVRPEARRHDSRLRSARSRRGGNLYDGREDPIYLAQADGLGVKLIGSIAERG